MDFTVIDWVLAAVAVFFTVTGLFKGLSGQLGFLAGLSAALLCGYLLFAPIRDILSSTGWISGGAVLNAAAIITDFAVMLLVCGIVQRIVARFVSFCMPQPLNSIAGALIGLLKSALIVLAFAAVGLVQTGRFSDGFFSSRSCLVKAAGELADTFK